MENKEKVVQVKDLTISFRTNNGTVKAVRDISFDLHKGETLAIVGESGSGKSVTSRAIMGILANNKIVEDGEILFEGKDLLKTSEEDYVRIRGAKIAMIFQDPMSSLNPIMHVGKQITESTILKGKADVKEAKKYLSILRKTINQGLLDDAEGKELVSKYITAYTSQQKNLYEYNYAKYYLEKSIAGLKALYDLLNLKGLANTNFYTSSNNFLTYFGASFNSDVIPFESKAHEAYKELVTITKKADEGKVEIVEIKDHVKELLDTCNEAIEEFNNKEVKDYSNLFYKSVFDKEYTGSAEEKNQIQEFISKVKNALDTVVKNINAKYDELANTILDAANDVSNFEEFDKTTQSKYKKFNKILKTNMNPLLIFEETPDNLYLPTVLGYVESYFNTIKLNENTCKLADKKYAQKVKAAAKNGEPTPVKEEVTLRSAKPSVEKANAVTENLKEFITKLSNHELDDKVNSTYILDKINQYVIQGVSIITKSKAKDKALELMREVGIPFPEKRFNQYPFQFSGGMRQRIVIAIAIASNPKVLICDEPTTALDVTIQAQILELINKLKEERQLSIIFITHDLGVVANMADRIAVMYAGKIVEYGLADEIFYEPRHPYTWALLSAMPDINTNEKLDSIPGTPPNMLFPPKGDAFAARNKYAMKIDFEKQPPFFKVSDTHYAATWLLHKDAPKVNPPKIVVERIKNMRQIVEQDYAKSGETIVDFELNRFNDVRE